MTAVIIQCPLLKVTATSPTHYYRLVQYNVHAIMLHSHYHKGTKVGGCPLFEAAKCQDIKSENITSPQRNWKIIPRILEEIINLQTSILSLSLRRNVHFHQQEQGDWWVVTVQFEANVITVGGVIIKIHMLQGNENHHHLRRIVKMKSSRRRMTKQNISRIITELCEGWWW